MKYYVINKSIYIIKKALCHEGVLDMKMSQSAAFVFEINPNGTVNLIKNRFNFITHFFDLDRALKFMKAYEPYITSDIIHTLGSIEELEFVLSI